MSQYIDKPFSVEGDRIAIPTDQQQDGSASFAIGFGHDYQKAYGTANAKDLKREHFNELFFVITDALRDIQTFGVAPWYVVVKYAVGAIASVNGRSYVNTTAQNTKKPDTDNSGWIDVLGTLQAAATKTYVDSQLGLKADKTAMNLALNDKASKTELAEGLSKKPDTSSLGNAAFRNVGTIANSVAAGNDSRIVNSLDKFRNLNDVDNKAQARINLQLGGAATLNVGSTAGTVAAGNDSRFGVALSAVQPPEIGLGNAYPVGNNDNPVGLRTGVNYYISGANIYLPIQGNGGLLVFGGNNALDSRKNFLYHGTGANRLFIAGQPDSGTLQWKELSPLNKVLGEFQKPRDVTGSRKGNTVYTNQHGRTIFVSVYMDTSAWFEVSENGVNWVRVAQVGGANDAECVCFPIPEGQRYRVNGTDASPIQWTELY